MYVVQGGKATYAPDAINWIYHACLQFILILHSLHGIDAVSMTLLFNGIAILNYVL